MVSAVLKRSCVSVKMPPHTTIVVSSSNVAEAQPLRFPTAMDGRGHQRFGFHSKKSTLLLLLVLRLLALPPLLFVLLSPMQRIPNGFFFFVTTTERHPSWWLVGMAGNRRRWHRDNGVFVVMFFVLLFAVRFGLFQIKHSTTTYDYFE
jgi:hypothetical protein